MGGGNEGDEYNEGYAVMHRRKKGANAEKGE